MNRTNNKTYQDFFKQIENLYLDDKYDQIINIINTHTDINLFDSTKKHYCEFMEICAISYIELGLFKNALFIINEYLLYLNKNEISTEEQFDDLTTFYLMKIEIYNKINSSFKQYKSVLMYIRYGGKDKQILDLKPILEETLFLKYVKVNKVIMYIMLGIILLSIISKLTIGGAVLSTLTTIGILWFLLNYIFHKKIKQIFIKLIGTNWPN